MAQTSRESFEQLYRSEANSTRFYFLRRGVLLSDVDDLVAEVFAVVWQRWDSIPERKRKPWTYGIARNVLYAHQRARTDVPVEVVTLSENGPEASVPLIATEVARDVWTTLAQLSQVDQDLLLAVAWDGLSPREAATALGIKSSTVRVRLHRARQRFVAAYGNPAGPSIVDIRDSAKTGERV